MEDITFENSLRVARVSKGLTQSELSERVGVTRQTIGLIESGNYNPTLKLCLILARVTEKSLDDLFWIKGGE
ncbi:helix-turn-helix transcriptional regulator [Candidatus Zixiibacteriota bacterium]